MMMCCNCGGNNNAGGGGSTGFKETVLYDGLINTVGTYNLTDAISNYDTVFIIHEYKTGGSRQSLAIPVRSLANNKVCHGNGPDSNYVDFTISKDILNVTFTDGSYRIVEIIGQKY